MMINNNYSYVIQVYAVSVCVCFCIEWNKKSANLVEVLQSSYLDLLHRRISLSRYFAMQRVILKHLEKYHTTLYKRT